MKVAFIADPLDGFQTYKDSTFAMMREAAARGHALYAMEQPDLMWRDGIVSGRARRIHLTGEKPAWYRAEPHAVTALKDFDAVLMRKDPPFDMDFFFATHLLSLVDDKRTFVINRPSGLREANEKLYATHFPQHMPRTMVTADRDRIFAFLKEIGGHGVIKPLDGAGGMGVMVLRLDDPNARSIADVITAEGRRLAMVQQFLPEVRKGDKRVLLLDGELLGAINRVPRADDIRSNIHVGGRVEPVTVTDEERAIIADLAPRLRADGLVFVGLDFIGGRLTEVNVTSPTGIQELGQHVGRDVAADVIAWVERKAEELSPAASSSNAPPR